MLLANDESELAADDLADDASAADGGRRKRKLPPNDNDPKPRGRQGRVTEDKDFWALFDAWMKEKTNDWGTDMNSEEWKG